MLPSQQLEQRRQRLARLQQERDNTLLEGTSSSSQEISSPSTTAAPPTTATPPTTAIPSTPQPRSTPRRTVSNLPGEKTCWICYETSTENPNRQFIHACDCTLLAHSNCLLEWISTRSSGSGGIPKCPVCATPILIEETRYKFLKLYRKSILKLHKLSTLATLGGLLSSGWLVSSCYGIWCMKIFMGKNLTNNLLSREYNNKTLPFKLWLNLPLIPFGLILSRTPLIDSLLPFLPLTLALSTHSHSHSHSLSSLTSDPYGLSDLSLQYPPSPTLTICLIPWFRILYFKTRNQIFKKILGKKYYYRNKMAFKGLTGMMEQAARDEQDTLEVLNQQPEQGEGEGGNAERRDEERGREGGGRNTIELVAELEYEYQEVHDEHSEEEDYQEEEEGGEVEQDRRRPRRRQTQPRQQQQQEEEEELEMEETRRDPPSSLRIGIGRLTSLIVGALIYPALSSLVGSILFWIALRGGKENNKSFGIKSLRKLLGISTSLISAAQTPSSSSSSLSLMVVQTLKFLNPFSPTSSSFSSLQVVDPVWVRNTIGGGIVLLIRDSLELVVQVLEKKRKQSRRIVERPVGESLSLQQQE